jgi:hypothetical protein
MGTFKGRNKEIVDESIKMIIEGGDRRQYIEERGDI